MNYDAIIVFGGRGSLAASFARQLSIRMTGMRLRPRTIRVNSVLAVNIRQAIRDERIPIIHSPEFGLRRVV